MSTPMTDRTQTYFFTRSTKYSVQQKQEPMAKFGLVSFSKDNVQKKEQAITETNTAVTNLTPHLVSLTTRTTPCLRILKND